jgi:hypothetical protein
MKTASVKETVTIKAAANPINLTFRRLPETDLFSPLLWELAGCFILETIRGECNGYQTGDQPPTAWSENLIISSL